MRAAFVEPVNAYVTEAWTSALRPLGIEVHDKCDPGVDYVVKYEDYDAYDFDTRNERTKFVYSYVYRKALTRKNYLGNTILQYRAKRPESSLHDAWPDSFNFELDYPEFLDDALDECWDLKQELQTGKRWILKPALGERAHGIRLFRTQEDLQKIFDETLSEDEDQMRQYIVQEYIAQPLLIDGRKFHLRVYCLCVGKLKVYVNKHMLALFSSFPYDEDAEDLKVHLTNTCYQGEQARVSLLEREVEDFALVSERIYSVVHDLFAAAEGDPINFQALPNAFEFFGLDFLLTRDKGVKLLEVNAYPDFKQTGAGLRHVVDDMFAETAALLVHGKEPARMQLVYDHDDQ